MAMMSLDMFLFEIGTLPYEQLAQSMEWRFAQGERFGARQATQFLGPGAEKLSLTGALYPAEGVGKYSEIETIRSMADAGEAYQLISGTGDVLGNWFIRSLSYNRSVFFVDGAARKGDFTIELERTDD